VRKVKEAMKKLMLLGFAALGLTAIVWAAPPGPIDGQNIPSNFGAGNLRATQRNYTGFGNYTVTPGALLPGNESDGLFLAKSGSALYVGIRGNLQTNGHAWMIAIGVPGRTGQTENRSEGTSVCPNGPPWTLQESAREVLINDQGTPETTDDTWSYGVNGMTLPCDTDVVYALDIFGGTMHVNRYTLSDPAGSPVSSWDPTPDNLGDPQADLFAVKQYVTEGLVGDGDNALNDQGFGFTEGGFDNSNVTGVTDTDGSSAATATAGLELAIPFGAVGDGITLSGTETIQVYVLLIDGAESSCTGLRYGHTINQVLPALGAGNCDPFGGDLPGDMGLRPDLSSIMACATVNLSTLPTFVGTAEGDLSDPGSEGYATVSTQTCATPYGDQVFDPGGITRTGGSELDALYVTSDAVNLYIGIPGNLEENGNKVNFWFDSVADGEHILTYDCLGTPGGAGCGGNNCGMEGDALPPLESAVGTNALFDYMYQVNVVNVNEMYTDKSDIQSGTCQFIGRSILESGNGDIDTLGSGSNYWGIEVALNNLNNDGVIGCGPFEAPCWYDSSATVAAAASTATSGFEVVMPIAELGLNPCEGPHDITIWVNLTGGNGWRANQSLPAARGAGEESVQNPGDALTDWYVEELILPETYYRSVAITHTTTPGVENDCNTNGLEDVCELFNETVPDCNLNAQPDSCDIAAGASQDCQPNGIPDECDIAGGASEDVNTNGIPDECEAAPTLSAIACCSLHGAFRLCLDLPQGGRGAGGALPIEPRRWQPGDSQEFEITLSGPASGPVTATASCTDGGNYAAASSVENSPGVLTATWTPPLPNTECCDITLSGGAAGTATVTLLFGDASLNGAVNSSDKNLIVAEIGTFANTSSVFWYDMDRNNAINTADKNLANAQIGTQDDPSCP